MLIKWAPLIQMIGFGQLLGEGTYSNAVDLARQLEALLIDLALARNVQDRWICMLDSSSVYSSKMAYKEIVNRVLPGPPRSQQEIKVFSCLWNTLAPSKTIVFTWQVRWGKLATKENLIKRNLTSVVGSPRCVLCSNHEESTQHLFFNCSVARDTWYAICGWLGADCYLPPDVFDFYLHFRGSVGARDKRFKGFLQMIWTSVIWQLWRSRNNLIFNTIPFSFAGTLDAIKVAAWKWAFAKSLRHIPFSNWCMDPVTSFLAFC